jgi:hypothetical protein
MLFTAYSFNQEWTTNLFSRFSDLNIRKYGFNLRNSVFVEI